MTNITPPLSIMGFTSETATVNRVRLHNWLGGDQHKTQEDTDAMVASYVKMTPMGRLGQPEEMAASIYFLASDESSFTTGINLAADGGLSEF